MKRFVCFIGAALFFILGVIGLIIPIIPQIPFFVISVVLAAIGSKRVRDRIVSTEFYKKHLREIVKQHKFLKNIFET